MSKHYYSTSNEEYTFEDAADAIDSVMGDDPEELIVIYRGELTTRKASSYAPNMEDELSNNAYNDVGEHSDLWPYCDLEAFDELQKMVERAIDDWADAYRVQPEFGWIKNVKQLTYRLNAKGKDAGDIDSDDYELIDTIDVVKD